MRAELPSGTVTFLFTDVERTTRLLHELGAERYAEALAEHRRVIREACSAHGGVEVDTQGDAFFLAFPTAPGGLSAAAELTDALAEGPLGVRVGPHTGTPLLAEEGYVGCDLHPRDRGPISERELLAAGRAEYILALKRIALGPDATANARDRLSALCSSSSPPPLRRAPSARSGTSIRQGRPRGRNGRPPRGAQGRIRPAIGDTPPGRRTSSSRSRTGTPLRVELWLAL